MEKFKVWVTAIICFSLLDFLCFTFVLGDFYRHELAPWARFNPNGSVHFSYLAGALVYALMALGFVIFVWPKIKEADLASSVLYCSLFGLVLYGTYDFTNLAFAKSWPVGFAMVDILWGVVAFGISGLVMKKLFK